MKRWHLFILLVFSPLLVHADFTVLQPESRQDYGHAQTGSFHNAITNDTPVSPEEASALERTIVTNKIKEKYYGRFRVNFSTLSLDSLKNTSTGIYQTLEVSKKRASGNQVGFEFAIGYATSDNTRWDVEYLANKNLVYSASPVLVGSGRNLTSVIKNNTILANLYYDFTGIYRFTPYMGVAFGLAGNSVNSTLSTGVSQTKRSIKLAYALGAGIRINIFKRWLLDAGYRYASLGSKFEMTPDNVIKLNGNYSVNLMSLGFIYLF